MDRTGASLRSQRQDVRDLVLDIGGGDFHRALGDGGEDGVEIEHLMGVVG